ncbi:MAG: HTH-type transcriptional activator CmpR [Pelotomaculum sp. PtaB.Bin013]|uniref:LysR family transcriptional regulator n=1 Tax=Pelotomaculum isophthalicicum JI TaxID=947010 RepID=A0A9X4H7G8_9FIRM|nr:selenium metabolism-associated LysR family transcriptional regulator [Pelotomaculum isophthalicicum]MDF9410037.1 LysR family transcriptional regulator [Pelotomaculum isophthalicicum JI]OPX82382.1 MAG: HTH-type transcriptional activator CmpR [Pelotomaculum sp. PtaB.Bin013]
MKFKQLETFLGVADQQSFTMAAYQLNISQPAVSFQIKALEDALDVTLFKREDKKMVLTDAGQLLYPEAKQIFMHYQKIKAELDNLKGLKKGHVVVGAGQIPGEYLLPLLIGAFKKSYPGIRITLKMSGSGQVERWIKEREVDLGITDVPVDSEDIECFTWLQDRLILIVSPTHPWVNSGTIKISDLKSEKMIFCEQGSGTRRAVEQKLAEYNIETGEIAAGLELGSTRAVITAVKAGLGVSIVSRFAVRESLKLGLVREVRVAGFDLWCNLYLVRHTQRMGGFAIDAFTSFINNRDILNQLS